MKRTLDVLVSILGLLVMAPLLGVLLLLIYLQDFCSPFYIADRVGRGGRPFRMVKLRSMVRNADRSGVSSTSATDRRITPLGRFIRACKLDEVPQLWNVLKGDMSLVGPRPQVQSGVALYTDEERRMLDVRPGITDLASIVFADEAEILRGSLDPDQRYNDVIRPYKSRLCLLYADRGGFVVDLAIISLTLLTLVSRRISLRGVGTILHRWNVEPTLIQIATRVAELTPCPPPGVEAVVAHSG